MPTKHPSAMPFATYSAQLDEALGVPVTVWSTDECVTRIELRARPDVEHTPPAERPPVLEAALRQIAEYAEGRRTRFGFAWRLPSRLTDFQQAVYERLANVEFGELTTYGEIANAVDRPGSARAVGQAMGANPLPLVLPCHRVVGSGGRLTGFGSGVPSKVRLLELEGRRASGDTAGSTVRMESRNEAG